MSDKLACGCVVEHGYPLSHRMAKSHCKIGEHLWQRYLSARLDAIQHYGPTQDWTATKAAKICYDAHIQAKTGGDDA